MILCCDIYIFIHQFCCPVISFQQAYIWKWTPIGQNVVLPNNDRLKLCFEDVPLVECMHLVFTHMPGERYHR